MSKKLRLLFLSLLLITFVAACSESKGVTGSAITGVPDNSSGSSNGGGTIGGTTPNGSHNGKENIPPVAGIAPDDQTADAKVAVDFSNALNLVGRYKITAITIQDPNGVETLNKTAANGEMRGAFAVNPNVSSTVSIDMGIKFQIKPDVVAAINLADNDIAYVNTKFNKPIDISKGLNFDKIFQDLGATIDVNNKKVYFKLTPPDMPLGEGYSITLALEKVSNKADFSIVNDPRKYWPTGDEPEAPVEPENPDTPDVDEPALPDLTEDSVITNIDTANLSTISGHYKFERFITVAAGITVDSDDIEAMKGEVALKVAGDKIEAVSKMQMKADVTGMTENDKYNYTVYEPFNIGSGSFTSVTPDPYIYSSAVITVTADRHIQIKQKLKKNAPVVGLTDVDVTVIAVKISDKPKTVVDCGYWSTDTIKQCKVDGSAALKNIDINDPQTLVGSYKLMNYGMEYQRPAGGQYEKIWAEVRVFDGVLYEGKLLVDKWQGDVSVKPTEEGNAIDFKVQLESSYQTQKEYLWGDFNDPRWRFFREEGVKDYTLVATQNKNEIGITIKRTFSYRYWGKQHNVPVTITFIAQKQSDEPQEVTNEKYWETSEQTLVIPDLNDPITMTGHYKLVNLGHNYQRPGGSHEDNWATNPTVMTNLRGEMSVKYNGSDIKTSDFHAKYQVDSSWYKVILGNMFVDSRWKSFNEAFNNPHLVQMEGLNLKVCIKRNFNYKNVGKNYTPEVNVCFVAEKTSDEPQEIK